jgi:hypothetical protein
VSKISRLILVFLGFLASLVSCGLLVEIPDSSGILYCPQTENQILSEQELPYIRFDFDVEKSSVEALLTIKDAEGALPGSFHWEGQTVRFRAQPELIPGRRYVFSFFGSFCDTGGREYSAHRIVPFYCCRREERAPCVVSWEPESGQVIGSHAAIRVRFSKAIDPGTLLRGLVIEPETEIRSSWENGDTEVVLEPRDGWHQCRCQTIELTEEILDTLGRPLAERRQIVFWVQEDIEPPCVLSIKPVYDLPAQLYPETGFGIEEPVGVENALRIEFSEPMDCDGTAGALVLLPGVTSSTLWLDGSTLVFVPVGGFAPNTEYLLDFGPAARDLAGNAVAPFEPLHFLTAPAGISVSTELVNDGIQLGPDDYSTAEAIEIEPYPITSAADYLLSFTFSNALFDSNGEKAMVQQAISLLCVLPNSGVADPVATGYSWTADRNLSITFSDLHPSTSTQRVYYLLRIRGGAGGIATDEGSRLEEDLEQLLVAAVREGG